jgi:UDP-glucose:(heptosyl)LPS alpha-1,3-glucosyltransferase
MRIALVIERFEARGGGVEAVAWNVAQGLATGPAGGDDVHVFARTIEPAADSARGGPEVHRLPVGAGWQPRRVWNFSRAAADATSDAGFDIVQTFSRTRHQDIFRAGGGCHAAYMERAYAPLGRTLRRVSPRHALALAIERSVFADERQLILCNSEMVREEIAERHGVSDSRLAVLVNGVDTKRFQPRVETGADLERDAHPDARRVWLLVGNGFERKGVETALRALSLRPADEVLWIAGGDTTGPWKARAEALGIGQQVRFLGRRADVEKLYASADALVLPTRYDAFANVCLEAAAAGLPVVTSASNGAATWLEDGGLVVSDPTDAEGFADALDRLANDHARAQMGAAARARAETRSWPHYITALRALYERWRR